MRLERIDVKRRTCAARPGDIPERADFNRLITGPTALYEGGNLALIYLPLALDYGPLVAALKRVKVQAKVRTNGLRNVSRSFGFATRNVIRGDFCSAVSLAAEAPGDHATICSYAAKVAEVYRAANPDLFAAHNRRARESVVADYRIEESPFTSGNVNKNKSLAYHYDRGNFPDVWSCCLVFRNDCAGGHLSCPEYGLGLECAHNSITMFDGQGLLHGVTPIEPTGPDPWRYSVVYYSLRQMWQCLGDGAELDRYREAKTTREGAIVGKVAYAGSKPEIRAWLKGRSA